MKRRLATWLQRSALLRWALQLAVYFFIPRQHVGVVGALFNEAGQVLLVEHVFRPHFPWGPEVGLTGARIRLKRCSGSLRRSWA